MNCSDFVRARKGGHHPEQSLTTYDSAGLFPFLCLTDNILSLARFFKHRMTGYSVSGSQGMVAEMTLHTLSS